MSVRTPRHRRRLARPLAALAACALVATGVAGCSGDSSGDASSSATPGSSSSSAEASSAAATPYLAVPSGVTLTAQGSELSVGDSATVAWQPDQKTIGTLDITVDRLERTTFASSFQGWQLTPQIKKTNPYFVRATVKNVGDTQLGGDAVPLYIVDGNDTLVESSPFASSFEPCPSTPLPKKFGPGAKAQVCLVFLSPKKGKLTAVSFRPTQEYAPITWTGPLETYKPGETSGSGSSTSGAKGGSAGGSGKKKG